MTKRIYIAGPMTGLPQFNYPAFNKTAERLRSEGHHVENPAENPAPATGDWLGYMRLSLAQLVTCDEVVMLPGWHSSKGAGIEVSLAQQLELTIRSEQLDAPVAAPGDRRPLRIFLAEQDGKNFHDVRTGKLIASYPTLVGGDFDLPGAQAARVRFLAEHPGYQMDRWIGAEA